MTDHESHDPRTALVGLANAVHKALRHSEVRSLADHIRQDLSAAVAEADKAIGPLSTTAQQEWLVVIKEPKLEYIGPFASITLAQTWVDVHLDGEPWDIQKLSDR